MTLKEKLGNFIVQASVYVEPVNKWIWLRIHKTAGTSLYDGHLREVCPNLLLPAQNSTAWNYWFQGVDPKDLEENYKIWSIIRNPQDRFISTAGMLGISPDDLARDFTTYRENGVIYRHTHEQHLYLYNDSECIAGKIGRYEFLQESIDNILDWIKVPTTQLPHLNQSKKRLESTDFSRNFVENHYSKDFERFGYKN